MVTIRLETRINAPAALCFDLSRNIDMHTASMKKSKEKAVAGVTSGLIEKGQFVTWRATHFFIPMYMTVKIVEMEFPHYFIDVMTNGPFKSLWHKHSFLQQDGYTIMKDEFIIEAPLGILGRFAEWLFLKSYMKNLLAKRNLVLKSIAETTSV